MAHDQQEGFTELDLEDDEDPAVLMAKKKSGRKNRMSNRLTQLQKEENERALLQVPIPKRNVK